MEPTGDLTLVVVRVGDQLVTAKADRAFRQDLDTPIALHVDPARVYLFEAAGGTRL